MASTRAGASSAQNPRSVAHGVREMRSASPSIYPSPCSHPTASSSSWSGVHIQVTAGRWFTSSQTGVSSTAASRPSPILRLTG